MASVGSTAIDFSSRTLLLAVILFFYSIPLTWHLVFFLPATILVFLLATALDLATAALNAKYRDFRLLTAFGLQIFQFLSPVFYSFNIIPPNLRWLAYLNPMAGPIELFRLSVTGSSRFFMPSFATSLAVDLILIVLCVRISIHSEMTSSTPSKTFSGSILAEKLGKSYPRKWGPAPRNSNLTKPSPARSPNVFRPRSGAKGRAISGRCRTSVSRFIRVS